MDFRSQDQAREEPKISFGNAIVIKMLGGAYEVRGGSDHERKQALEWFERFHPKGFEANLPSDAQWAQAMRPSAT